MELPHYDLHCHSTASDGALSPIELLGLAKNNNIDVLALTDHDTVAGVKALQAENSSEIKIISGTELTCLWNGRVIHIVGLGVDLESDCLNLYLSNLANLRIERSKKMSQQLVSMGLPDVFDQAKQLAGEGSIGRPHFARALREQGAVANEQQAFKKYLGIGKKGDVKMAWPELSETVSVIKAAGGIAILAHPTKYKMTFTKLRLVIADFVKCGGEALEVSYPGITPDHHYHLLRIAKENDLLLSAGSDFHAPSQGWTDLGKYPPIRVEGRHVLERLLN
ncbi:PHP domain-containing protein [Neptuniibacter sp. QD29_5]|uniref:PHP domain-containing protein n=1 Tax=Neptuniibacter sp. QD29_5 TaxID=3398207 RepID=UPI0039F4AA40